MAAILNTVNFNRKLQNLTKAKPFVGFMKSAANTRFVSAKKDMMEELDNDEVIQEIKEACANPATTSSEIVDKGNLASVIGFPKGSHPENALKEFLKTEIQMDSNPIIDVQKNKTTYSFKISLPTKSSLDSNLPSPDNWISKSWVRIIEEGISSSLKRYIFWSKGFNNKSNSRSTTGLQVEAGKMTQREAKFTPKQFLTNIINNFIAKFE